MVLNFFCLSILSECRSKRDTPRLYPHATDILYALKDKGVKLAIASRSPTPVIANTFLEKLGIKSMFDAQVRKVHMRYIPYSCILNLHARHKCI